VDPEPLDTGGAIRYAATQAGIDETFLVVNGDVLTDADLSSLMHFHRARGAEASLHLTPVADPSAFGVVPTDDDGRVAAFVEKPPPGSAPTNLISAGAYVLEASVLDRIPTGRPVSVERETFPALVAGGRLYAWASQAYWIDTGTPAAYLRACVDLLSGTRPPPPAPGARLVAEGVWATGSPLVEGVVEAPVLVADAATVDRGARVAGSVVGAGARVEAGAEVTGSVVLAGAVIGAGARVAGSIVGEGSRVGAGAVLTDLCVVGNRQVVDEGVHLVGRRVPS
jgi:NDP-sugar pyrophosphorylase family protein